MTINIDAGRTNVEDTTDRRRIAMSGPVSLVFTQIYHFLRSEGYTVTWVSPQSAFEQLRWQRPALIIINREEQNAEADALIARLGRDPDTQAINILVWAGTNPITEHPYTEGESRRVSVAHMPLDVHSILQQVGALATHSSPETTLPSLHAFVDQAIPDWATFLIAAYIGQNPAAVINAEDIATRLDLCEDCVAAGLVQLANAGYIEPIAWENDMPLFTLVVDTERVATLHAFGHAVMSRNDRLMLATLILARERSAA